LPGLLLSRSIETAAMASRSGQDNDARVRQGDSERTRRNRTWGEQKCPERFPFTRPSIKA
jgi:hypothetical protein